jgi:hypothetical protein
MVEIKVTIFDYLETLVLDDLKLSFVRGSTVKPCLDTITQNVPNAGLVKQQFIVQT